MPVDVRGEVILRRSGCGRGGTHALGDLGSRQRGGERDHAVHIERGIVAEAAPQRDEPELALDRLERADPRATGSVPDSPERLRLRIAGGRSKETTYVALLDANARRPRRSDRSEEHTSELQSL